MPALARRTLLTGAAAASLATPAIRGAKGAAPFFKMYMIIPNNQPARMAWGTLAARQFTQIGIEVVPSYVPFSAIYPRRNKGDGKTYVDGGWDAYLERYYYSSLKPVPNSLFSTKALPPAGQNYYYVEDPVIDRTVAEYAGSVDPGAQDVAIKAFQKRWLETEPLTILFYPEDVIATNPKLSGFDSTTFRPAYYPRPENWTVAGGGADASAAFACWPPPDSVLPLYSQGYQDSNVAGPVYNQLLEYESWDKKEATPALAASIDSSADGKKHVINLRPGVTWHSGEPFTAEDVVFTFDTTLNPAVASDNRAILQEVFGGTGAYKVTGPLQVTVELPAYSMLFREFVLTAVPIMPKHAYGDIKPEQLRTHTINTWRQPFTVKTSKGSYTSKGAIGTGPWVCGGFDPARKSYSYTKNAAYWKKTPGNVTTYYHVAIQGADAVLAALKSGDIDAHDPMYDVGTQATTIDLSWGKLNRFDSFKWQHICYNLRHPIFGTGTDTPLGKQDPARAAEAAAYVRKAFSFSIPRDEIIKQMAAGVWAPGDGADPVVGARIRPRRQQADPVRHGAGQADAGEGGLQLMMKLGLSMRYLGYHDAAWRHPDVPSDGASSYAHFLRCARRAEEGKFDMVFFADGIGVRADDNPPGSLSHSNRNVELEPLTLLAALAPMTERIGLVTTASTTYNEPYHIARKFASLDHISGGRAGWNIVTSWSQQEAWNFNRDAHLDYDTRYDRAAEFVEVVTGLWRSWEPGAFVREKATGRYYDPEKLHVLNHKGKHFQVRGPLSVDRTPQGRPILVQAGANEAGQEIAARHSDVVYSSAHELSAAQAYYRSVKGRMAAHGRDPAHLLIMPALRPTVARTRAEARAQFDRLQELIDPLVGLAGVYVQMGDLSSYPLDGPVPEPVDAPVKSLAYKWWETARKQGMTIRQFYTAHAGGGGLQVIGTASDVADLMEHWVREGACDGFNLTPTHLPAGIDDFVELVVPELQRRGVFRREYEGATLRENLGLGAWMGR